MNKKGFTLVELLAVIVILAVILAIAIPSINGIINSASRGSFESTAKMLIKAIEYKVDQDNSYDVTRVVKNNGADTINSELGLDGSNFKTVSVSLDANSNISVNIVGQNKWDGLNAVGTRSNIVVSNYIPPADTTGANAPVLSSNMIPVTWDGANWVKADITNPSTNPWYNYANKQWANAVMVSSANRSTYLSAAAGTTINMNDILMFFVWIPRFIYTIPTASFHTNVVGEVGIKFITGTDDTTAGVSIVNNNNVNDSNGTWTSHPSFTFNSQSLKGLWAGKFESGYYGAATTADAQQDVTTANKVIIKPNAYSWRAITLYNMFTVSRQLEDSGNMYGFVSSEVDTHMMKNTDWGAISYLSLSAYGKDSIIWLNNNSNCVTGCAGTSAYQASTTSCNTYESSNGINASTTGNVYGIYDMSGGAGDVLMGNLGDNLSTSNSQITTTFWDSIKNVYADVYPSNDYAVFAMKGDAIYEASSGPDLSNVKPWGSVSSTYSSVNTTWPWFTRGKDYRMGTGNLTVHASVIAQSTLGNATNFTTFRIVVTN